MGLPTPRRAEEGRHGHGLHPVYQGEEPEGPPKDQPRSGAKLGVKTEPAVPRELSRIVRAVGRCK